MEAEGCGCRCPPRCVTAVCQPLRLGLGTGNDKGRDHTRLRSKGSLFVAKAERGNAPFQMVSATPLLPHPCVPCCQAANLRQEMQGKSHQHKELQQEGEGKRAGNGAL